MLKLNKNTYDVIIIGAGISGLVCGCYLAKAGMKVLIIEQHNKAGGYCTSFRRNDFIFDAAAHSFGAYRENGTIRRVFDGLEIHKKIEIKKFDPTDIIITPDYKISFWADLNKTLKELQKAFSEESDNINNFFNFLLKPEPNSLSKIRSWTFKNLLDQYFTNNMLKTILATPLLGYGGLPPSLISAFSGTKIYTEFLLDGGYYPEGGMQALSNALAERFKEFGGQLLLSRLVKKIKVKNSNIAGVILEKNGFIPSTYVVSSCDARQTFLRFLGKKIVSEELLNKLNNMTPSLSMFILYLGIDKYFKALPKPGSNIWFLPHYDIEKLYLLVKNRNTTNLAEHYMVRLSPDGRTILAFVNAPFKNKGYWVKNKEKLLESFIGQIEKNTIPNLSKHIVYKDAATPYTLFRYTLNYEGAAYGWAGMPSQFADSDFKKPPFLKGLYLTGHWTTYAQGISGVAYMGRNVAKLLLRNRKITF